MFALSNSWQRAYAAIGARSTGDDLRDDLLARYREPHRKYHTLQHLTECLETLETVREQAAQPAQVELALWFHDAIYDTSRHDNELQSAALARDTLLDRHVGQEFVEPIVDLILATAHVAPPKKLDQQLIVDIDLAILGASPVRFTEYEQQIRAEYAFVPESIFRTKRAEILQRFLNRPSIYSTEYFQAKLEAQARENLRKSIENLST